MTSTLTIRSGNLEKLNEKNKESDMSSGGTSDANSPIALLDMMGLTHAMKLGTHVAEDIVFFAEFLSKMPLTLFDVKAYDQNLKSYKEKRKKQDKKFEDWTDKSFTSKFIFTFGNTTDGLSDSPNMTYPLAGYIGETFYDFMSPESENIAGSLGNVFRNIMKIKLFGDVAAIGINGVVSISTSFYEAIPKFFSQFSLDGTLEGLKDFLIGGLKTLGDVATFDFDSVIDRFSGIFHSFLDSINSIGVSHKDFGETAKQIYNDHFRGSVSNTFINDIKTWFAVKQGK
jgi:hypothetical protein